MKTKLNEWMQCEGLDDDALATLIGGCSPWAVKKWKYGERQPLASKVLRIEELSGGEVTLRDLILPNLAPPSRIARLSAASKKGARTRKRLKASRETGARTA
jgi:DNA-binding transcriptional regulator YdaS (Cro superfamily)